MELVGPSSFLKTQWLSEASSHRGEVNSESKQSIATAAQGLEELFVSVLIKQMRETLDPETMFGKDSGDVYGGMFDSLMSQHLVQGGGLGIARMVTRQWEAIRSYEFQRDQ